MYPNPQDVLPLPPRPHLDHYRKRARALVAACRSREPSAVRAWAERWVRDLVAAQPAQEREAQERDATRRAGDIEAFARERLGEGCALNQAQFVIARAHGFASWTRFVRHLEELAIRSQTAAFERAADAVVGGDLATLQRLLDADPGLVHARSTREHRATLLHYVAANGVENYRQRTPAGIVAIARLLLDRGAAVDAEADVYGGGATPLGLVVTSAHPRRAGVQQELADLLIGRGARIAPGSVRACLMNGCPEAGEHLYRRGAPIGLAEAAGIGETAVVREHFADGCPAPSPAQVASALSLAARYDRLEVIALLLDQGVDPGLRGADGETALHIAAYEGKAPQVELLLRRGAPVEARDTVYGTPPLVWALHAWLVEARQPGSAYREILLRLVDAGARVEHPWIDDERLRRDGALFDALSRAAVP